MNAPETFLAGRVTLHCGDSREVLRTLPDASVHAVACDPPYALVSIGKRFGRPGAAPAKDYSGEKAGAAGAYARASAGFMGQGWDTGETAFAVEFWAEVMRVLKPGGHVVAFGGTRSFHRLSCAIEDSGFEIRDCLMWLYGSGFPKSHDVAKAVDKAAGHWRGRAGSVTIPEQPAKGREYERTDKGKPITAAAAAVAGWGTALKPAWEPIILARKPLAGTVAETVLAHGTGALNIDGCRVGMSEADRQTINRSTFVNSPASVAMGRFSSENTDKEMAAHALGRWPANVVHDGSPEVVAAFPAAPGQQRVVGPQHEAKSSVNVFGDYGPRDLSTPRGDSGSAARFFYSAKADGDDRLGSKHPTVKPVALMQWLVRLVTPPGGVVLDPFAGTGTTGEAAWREGFSAILIEREPQYQADIRRRMKLALGGPDERKREAIKARHGDVDAGPLFGGKDSSPGADGLREIRTGRTIGPIGLRK